ncbi:unnamed protein product, partial [Urochloa humidicola]
HSPPPPPLVETLASSCHCCLLAPSPDAWYFFKLQLIAWFLEQASVGGRAPSGFHGRMKIQGTGTKCYRAREGGCKFITWYEGPWHPFVASLLIDLRDTVWSLKELNRDLRLQLHDVTLQP